jgi:hypothetical protein
LGLGKWSYDHDQPRDDNGRWTASGNAADPVGHPARKPQQTGVQVARNDAVMSDAGRPRADVQVAQAPPIEPPPPLPESLGAARPVEGPAKEPSASPSSGTESGPAENPRGEYDTTDGDVKFGSTTGPRFDSGDLLTEHFQDHRFDFDAETEAEYGALAASFLSDENNPDILELTRPANNDLVRFNPETDEFGILSSDGHIITYYKPDPRVHGYPTNLDYFYAQKGRTR